MDLSQKIKKNLLNERNYYESSDIIPTIKQLGEVEWSKGKRRQLEACKLLTKVAESDERVAQVFMREMDRASTNIAAQLVKRVNEGYFSVRKFRKLSEKKLINNSNGCPMGGRPGEDASDNGRYENKEEK